MDAAHATLGMRLVEERTGKAIHAYLTEAYEQRALTQSQIAAEIGVDAATVSRWMRTLGIQARVIGHRKSRSAAA